MAFMLGGGGSTVNEYSPPHVSHLIAGMQAVFIWCVSKHSVLVQVIYCTWCLHHSPLLSPLASCSPLPPLSLPLPSPSPLPPLTSPFPPPLSPFSPPPSPLFATNLPQLEGERNYHIFYRLLAGMSRQDLAKLHLVKDPYQYSYLTKVSAVSALVDALHCSSIAICCGSW